MAENRTTAALRRGAAACLFAGAMALAVPGDAETLDELDAMSDASADEDTGIRYAQEQAARGEWLEAIATLERVLAVHPKSDGARLLRVLYLCKVDDRRGSAVEYSKLKTKRYDDAALADVRAQCGFAGGD